MHTMTDYPEGLDIGHNTLQCDCSMSDICHSYSHSLQSPKYKNTYLSMSHSCRRVIASDGRVVNLPSCCYDFLFFFCRCCHVMSGKRRCSVAEDVRAHSLLGVADH